MRRAALLGMRRSDFGDLQAAWVRADAAGDGPMRLTIKQVEQVARNGFIFYRDRKGKKKGYLATGTGQLMAREIVRLRRRKER